MNVAAEIYAVACINHYTLILYSHAHYTYGPY